MTIKMIRTQHTGWQPLSTAPRDGKFLIAKYAPTNWAYSIQTVQMSSDMPPRHRAIQFRYARAWQPMLLGLGLNIGVAYAIRRNLAVNR